MRILFIGDIVGRPGRNAVKALLPALKQDYKFDLTLANGENMAAGIGMTYEKYQEMKEVGIDYFTGGNHTLAKKEFWPYLDDPNVSVLRPANYEGALPGRGDVVLDVAGKKVHIINLVGRAFMKGDIGNYLDYADTILEAAEADIRIVDFHAEATSEKIILADYLDGKVTAVLGTHTHVPTADTRILPKGTAFQTDIGMTGPLNSSLGAKIEPYYQFARFNTPALYKVASGPVTFNAVYLEIDDETNKVTKIERIQRQVDAS
ncbi:MAG TPA: TIGR00282 family metallophosphoesterase [Patescibacteria group bacterium]